MPASPLRLPEAGIVPASAAEDPGFGVYVHWPFCRSKCPYCDFNSHVRDKVEQPRWRRALEAELAYFAARLPRRSVTSIFFGGGTPSLMPPDTAASVIAAVGRHFPVAGDIEVTLEANPTSVEAGRFAAFRDAGVNRVSLGVQALDDAALRFLGRQHSAAEALTAVATARRHFARVSFDLIYARPEQSAAAWRAELARALDHGLEHLSLYQLTIEPNTGFHGAVARGVFTPPDADAAATLYELTQELCDRAGLPAYEISNHARSGAASRHNLTYWRCGDYIGIGPGAHGRVTIDGIRHATQQVRKPETWLERVENIGHAIEIEEAISAEMQFEELLMMGLRLAEGVPLERMGQVGGRALAEFFAGRQLQRLIDGGFLLLDATHLKATSSGRQVLNTVLAELL
ncbi:MAG TPA: radical SAM family heme chaperone HemW [Candidatus Sulfotelmatobacter sp.]|nr:radical SAM family heme chaperone HemW [Candidatus Sulfotelmatobacter sp.]